MPDPEHLAATDASAGLLQGLNPPQQQAVLATEGPVLVVAGAGSGKTRVLTHRIAHLIRDQHVNPFAILAITFTNKAADEMASRVGELVGSRLSDRMWVTTFHKACVRILRRELHRLGYRSGFTIYDAQDSRRLITQIIKDLGIDDKRITPRGVQHEISRAKDELIDFETYKAKANGYPDILIADVYERYQDRLLKANALDFDDLIMRAVELLQLFPEVLEHYQRRFQYLMVDEYQDTNRAQYHLVNLLAAGHRNLMVVGDADQCLLPGTKVSTPAGLSTIEDLRPGDRVLASGGGSDAISVVVRNVMEGHYVGRRYRVTTDDGRAIDGTAHHLLPVRVEAVPGRHIVYLMYRADRGFRIGRTKSARPARRGEQPKPGYLVRANQEHADKLWVLAVCDQIADAAYWESYYAAEYGLPTACFHGAGRELAMTEDRLEELYGEVNTEDRAAELMADLDLSFDHPHHRPQGGGRRQSANVVMFQDWRAGDVGYHRLSWSSTRADVARQLERAGLPVRSNGKGGYRVETSRKSYRGALDLAAVMQEAAGLELSLRAQVDGRCYDIQPLSHCRPGMQVLVERGGRFEEATVAQLTSQDYDGPVYDLEVDRAHMFVADGVLVHNSIYGFRGATIRNILDFEHDYPDATVIPLTRNYRSTETILTAANTVIKHNRQRKPKDLWTDKGRGARVVRYHASDEHDEAAFVSEEVERLRREEGVRFDEVAIFYRTNAQSRVLEEVFVRVGTPYQVIGGVRFYERKEVKDLLAYARLLVNPTDDVSARRVVNTPRRSIGRKTEEAVDWHARREGMSFLEACREAEHIPQLGARAVSAVTSFVDLLDLLRTEMEEGADVPELIETIWQRTGYMKELQAERTIEALGREENLRELKSVAQELHERDIGTGRAGLEGFLESVTLVTEQDNLVTDDEGDGNVTLMTLHNAKGLEYPVVFMVGLEDGVFPHVRSLSDSQQLEEERRLCYVGLTRAQERLYVTHADHRTLWGGRSYNPPSRFLKELPEEVVDAKGATMTSSAASRARDREALRFEGEEFAVGDRVVHPKFGEGRIAALAGEGERSEATVDFDAVGRKQLLLAYAPIVKA